MAKKKTQAEAMGSPDWILLGTTIALLAIGLMMVYSSTFDMGYRLHDDSAYYFQRQAIFMGLGLVTMFVATRVHYRHWMKISVPFMLLILAVLTYQAISGKRVLVAESVSPVEPAKLAVVVYVGHWLASKRVEQLRKLPVGLLPFTIIVGLVVGLVMVQPDISEALVILLVALAMFFMAGAHLVQFIIGILGGTAAFVFVVRRIPYAMDRIGPYLLQWRDPLNSDNLQLKQGLIALGSGGLFGLGPGNGRMKYQWLPAAHTDSIFAVVGEEMGLVGCVALIAFFAVLAYRGFRISHEAPDTFGRLMALGITCWITFQALINMAVVTGTIPYTGITLPFISVGGSSLVACMAGMGILLSISRAANAEQPRRVTQEEGTRRHGVSSLEHGTVR